MSPSILVTIGRSFGTLGPRGKHFKRMRTEHAYYMNKDRWTMAEGYPGRGQTCKNTVKCLSLRINSTKKKCALDSRVCSDGLYNWGGSCRSARGFSSCMCAIHFFVFVMWCARQNKGEESSTPPWESLNSNSFNKNPHTSPNKQNAQ